MANTPITLAHGDGIGPKIIAARLHILKEADAKIDIEEIEIGEKVYLRGVSAGIEPSAIDLLKLTITRDVFRYRSIGTATITPVDAASLVSKAAGAGLDVAKYESLYNFDGKAGFSLGQGQ